MDKTTAALYISGAILGLIYLVLINLASNGYGYPGYYGYYRGGSFWYWGAPNTYHDKSVRSGSGSGAGVRGGGPGSGK